MTGHFWFFGIFFATCTFSPLLLSVHRGSEKGWSEMNPLKALLQIFLGREVVRRHWYVCGPPEGLWGCQTRLIIYISYKTLYFTTHKTKRYCTAMWPTWRTLRLPNPRRVVWISGLDERRPWATISRTTYQLANNTSHCSLYIVHWMLPWHRMSNYIIQQLNVAIHRRSGWNDLMS